jgi:hypothetical protein
MASRTPTPESERMTVFRPRRRCPKCGLVNADNASKCRRCGRSFSDFDPAYESERVVARMRAWRVGAVVLAVLLVGGLAAAALAYRAKMARLADYTERARAIQTDLVSIKRSAQADAAALVGAFDEKEAQRILRDQADAWSDRAQQCDNVRHQVDDLLPQNDEQTANELQLERDLAAVASASHDIAEAAKRNDLFASRVAAGRLAHANGSSE